MDCQARSLAGGPLGRQREDGLARRPAPMKGSEGITSGGAKKSSNFGRLVQDSQAFDRAPDRPEVSASLLGNGHYVGVGAQGLEPVTPKLFAYVI
jgi:hypothetical protein